MGPYRLCVQIPYSSTSAHLGRWPSNLLPENMLSKKSSEMEQGYSNTRRSNSGRPCARVHCRTEKTLIRQCFRPGQPGDEHAPDLRSSGFRAAKYSRPHQSDSRECVSLRFGKCMGSWLTRSGAELSTARSEFGEAEKVTRSECATCDAGRNVNFSIAPLLKQTNGDS
jgi:hypothetical protein